MLENKPEKLPNWKEKHDCLTHDTKHVNLERASSLNYWKKTFVQLLS